MSCLRTTLLRATRTTLLSATFALAALTLTACGGPSESKAKDTAVELMTAMYENDIPGSCYKLNLAPNWASLLLHGLDQFSRQAL